MNLELFCCSGGMAAGFRAAGIAFDLAFDADPDACASYEANLGHRPVQMDARDLLRMARAGWRPGGGVRLLVADPPCTPWSRAGKRRGTGDDRDMLAITAELIAILRPETYLIGNVPGLADANNAGTVQRVIGGLSKYGYCTADYAKLDAASFGVPQHRVRPFWFGHRLETPCILWPLPTHGDPSEVLVPHIPGIEPLRPWATCREALRHLAIEDIGRPVRLRATSEIDMPDRTIRSDGGRAGRREAVLMRTITSEFGRSGQAKLTWPWDRPATSIMTDPRIAPPGHHEGRAKSFTEAIILSERSAAILQGFPDPGAPGGWRLVGKTKKSRWSQLGQAMPPPLAEAVARSVRARRLRPANIVDSHAHQSR